MENNEIMERLLQDDKQAQASVKETSKSQWSGDIQISRIRIISAKYKVYIVLMLVFIAILAVYIPKAQDSLKWQSDAYNQAKSQLRDVEISIEQAENDMDYLCDDKLGIVNNEEILRNCLNEKINCANLPVSWKVWSDEKMHYDLSIPLSYLQMSSLWNRKMPVDEKRVLRNLNEYLIKHDISWNDRRRVWDILKINIWDPEPVEWWEDHFFKVTVDVEIEFSTVNDLTDFLHNIEKKIIENNEDRILYKIQAVSYDIVTNDEPQVTDISMVAYYYHDERFEDKTITVIANVEEDTIKLEAKWWNDTLGNVKLKQQVKMPENREIEAKDLLELPEWETASFGDWQWIDKNQKWVQQEVKINIIRDVECGNSNRAVNTNDDLENSDDSEWFFQNIFKNFKK